MAIPYLQVGDVMKLEELKSLIRILVKQRRGYSLDSREHAIATNYHRLWLQVELENGSPSYDHLSEEDENNVIEAWARTDGQVFTRWGWKNR
jgi:hypothetical protein